MESTILVFVYGTLRKNEPNAYLLKEAKCIAEQAWTKGRLFATTSYYPTFVCHPSGRVYGELYEISEKILKRLDQLEGYDEEGGNNFYDRQLKTVYTDQGEYEAFVYVATDMHDDMLKEPIPYGDWKVYQYMNQDHLYYFAYGSCMDHRRFQSDGIDHYFHEVLGRGVLEGYTLRFTHKAFNGGRADIVEEGGIVEGKVYKIPYDAISYLYCREGVHYEIYRPAIVSVKLKEREIEALTFIVINKEQEEVAPPFDYMEEIIRGGDNFLSPAYMKKLQARYYSLINK